MAREAAWPRRFTSAWRVVTPPQPTTTPCHAWLRFLILFARARLKPYNLS